MQYVTLPQTDLKVSCVALGSSMIGSRVNRDDSFALFDAFVEAGGTFLDTAHVYANWAPGPRSISEKTIGAWLKASGARGKLVIASKGGHPEPGYDRISRLSPAEIVGDLDESLDFLGIERLDLYWLHRDDLNRPVGEMLEVVNEQVQLGKIRYFGCSNWRPARIREAQAYAAAHKLRPFVASQIFWSLAVPNSGVVAWDHADMDDEAEGFYATAGLSVHAFTSQARGYFTKATDGGLESLNPKLRHDFENPVTLARLQRAQQLARELGTTVTAVILASIMSRPFVSVPILGCVNLDQLRDSLGGVDLTLSSENLRFLLHGVGSGAS
jgi:aryl-alcohol dehydrogenase-like predicted oxidoreductase